MASASVNTAAMVNPGDLRNTRRLKRTSCIRVSDEVAAERFVDLFLVLLAAAELDARAAFGLGAIHAGALQIVGAVLNVRAKFLVHLGAELERAK